MDIIRWIKRGLAGSMPLYAAVAMAQAEKPNIVLIVTDQQSYDAVGALSHLYPGAYCRTPHIDRLVKEGTAFTQAFCSNPVSVPSRFALFTGCYGGTFRIRENQCREAEEAEVRGLLAANGMGHLFARHGYDTYYGGKVHLPFAGKHGRNKADAPVGYGFEHYFTRNDRDTLGWEAARIIREKGENLDSGRPDKPFLLVASFINPHDICLESSTGMSGQVQDKGGRKQAITEQVRQIRSTLSALDSLAFFRDMAPALPANIGPTVGYPPMKKAQEKDFTDHHWRKYRWVYAQLVELVDRQIGCIVDALGQYPSLKRNTIVVFTSDHGEMQGAHRMATKSVPYDECQRVPFVFCGPGIRKNRTDSSLVCNGIDLLPTLCSLAGIEPPRTDGLSLAGLLRGGQQDTLRRSLYLEGKDFYSVVSADYKYTRFDLRGGSELLIDRKKDRGEMQNVIRHTDFSRWPIRRIAGTRCPGNVHVGIAVHAGDIGQLSSGIADREFGYVTSANDFKQACIHPAPDIWRWERPDRILEHVRQQGQLLRMHSPIGPQCSGWTKADSRTPRELEQMLEEYLTALCATYNRHADAIRWMDVVNETIDKDIPPQDQCNEWNHYGWMGDKEGEDKWENPWIRLGYDHGSPLYVPLYIDKAFEVCNRLAPGIKQLINQHGDFEEEVWKRMKLLVEYLRSHGRRVDGVGWQAHIQTGWELVPGNLERLERFVLWCHRHDLEFHITEMNVWMKPGTSASEAEQAETFAKVADCVLRHCHTGVVGINFWNVRDGDTSHPDWKGCLWRNDGTPRPAYFRIKELLCNIK